MPRKQRIRARNMNSTALSMEGRTSPGPGSHCCPSSLALLRRKWQTAILFLAAMAFFLALALFSGVYFGSSQRSSAAAAQLAATDADVPVYGFVKVAEYPHDPNAFTQVGAIAPDRSHLAPPGFPACVTWVMCRELWKNLPDTH